MNNYFAIMPDVGCDLEESLRKEYDIDFINGHYTDPTGKENDCFLKWENDEACNKFYADLKKNPNGYKTAPANVEEYCIAFEKYVKKDIPVLAISISSGISSSHSNMEIAKKELLEKYPNAKIYCLDTLRFGPGYGLMAIYASIFRKEGKTIDEVVTYFEENKNRFHQTGWLDDLSFVAKKGRISNAKAFFGSLIGVKPIGEFDYNGLTTVIGKAKGEKQAYEFLLKYMENEIENPEDQIIIIANSCRRKQAEVYKGLIQEKFHPKKIYINDVFPFCGINIGPGLMAAYYIGKPISKDLVEEKNLFEKIQNGEV